MALKRTKSKRKSGKISHIIKKKAKAQRKRQKKVVITTQRKKRKDPGIPNLYPFKQQLLEKLINRKKHAIDLKKSTKRFKDFKEPQVVEQKAEQIPEQRMKDVPRKNKIYSKMLDSVVEKSDVILFVLDARDPNGCRNKKLEQLIKSKDSASLGGKKKIILVLNKIDLVPALITTEWINHLKRESPVIAFKASTQGQKRNLGAFPVTDYNKIDNDDLSRTKLSIGTESLFSLLKLYAASKSKSIMTVGVVGYPNVGKSSIINSLKRKKITSTSPVPGHTKNIQTVILDKRIKLFDSPGVIFDDENNYSQLVLKNSLRIEDIKNPENIVDQILKKCPKMNLCAVYNISPFDKTEQFLYSVAAKKGLLKKGGIANVDAAARSVIRDWNSGKVSYYTSPPVETLSKFDEINIIEGDFKNEIERILEINKSDIDKCEMVDDESNQNRPIKKFVPIKE